MAAPYQMVYSSALTEKISVPMAVYYKAFIPHIANYMPEMDYNKIGIKAIDYGYISIIERIGIIPDLEKMSPRTTTIQNWGYTFSNLGFEFVKLNPATVNNVAYKRAVIIDRDFTTLLILFEAASPEEIRHN